MKYKIPFRQIYCETLSGWLHEVLWCFVVIPLFQSDIEQARAARVQAAAPGTGEA